MRHRPAPVHKLPLRLADDKPAFLPLSPQPPMPQTRRRRAAMPTTRASKRLSRGPTLAAAGSAAATAPIAAASSARRREPKKKPVTKGAGVSVSDAGGRKMRGTKTPKTPREPPARFKAEIHDGDATDDEIEVVAADETTDDDEFFDENDLLRSLPHDIRLHIFSFVTTDAAKWAPYRMVNTLFADYSDLATKRVTITGTLRLAMYRRMQGGVDPSQMMWDLFSRFADTLEHLDVHETGTLSDLTGIKYFERLRTVNLSGCWAIEDLGAPLNSALAARPPMCYRTVPMLFLDRSILLALVSVSDPDGLEKCVDLQELNLSSCSRLTDLGQLHKCEHLQRLNLSNCLGMEDISAVSAHWRQKERRDCVAPLPFASRLPSSFPPFLRASFAQANCELARNANRSTRS